MPEFEHKSALPEPYLFATTHWSVVVSAKDSSPAAQQALEKLCAAYWYPLYAYIRRQGHTEEAAKDLTQDFFARLLEQKYIRLADPSRGRFRSFLLSSLKNFLINEWAKANREKRGGGKRVVSWDEQMAESRFDAEPATGQAPDSLFDRGWAATLLDRALTALRAEFEQTGKLGLFECLKPYVLGQKEALPYAEMALELGMTEGATRVAAHRLSKRCGELLRAEVAQTVSTPAEVNEELRYLVSVLRDSADRRGNDGGYKL